MRDLADCTQVGHGHGLTTDGVVCDTGENQRDIIYTNSINELLEFIQVHIALKGIFLIAAVLGNLIQQFLIVQIARDRAHLLDVALSGVKVTVGGDGEDLTGITLGENLLHDFHQHRFGSTALLNDESIGALHLGSTTIKETTLILTEIDFFYHLLHIAAVGTDQIQNLLPVLLAAALKDVAECIQQHIIAGIAAIGFIAHKESCPLVVGHGSGTGVGEHVHRQHASGESKLIVVQCFQHTFTLFYRHIGDVADSKRKMMGRRNG